MDLRKDKDPKFATEFDRLFLNQPTWVGVRAAGGKGSILFEDGTVGSEFLWSQAEFVYANLGHLRDWLKEHYPEVFL